MTAKTGQTPSQRYAGLAANFGSSAYARQGAPATREQKATLGTLDASQVKAASVGGEAVTSVLTTALGNKCSHRRAQTPRSRCALRARRTSTRSTPSPCATVTTCARSSTMPEHWSTGCWSRSPLEHPLVLHDYDQASLRSRKRCIRRSRSPASRHPLKCRWVSDPGFTGKDLCSMTVAGVLCDSRCRRAAKNAYSSCDTL